MKMRAIEKPIVTGRSGWGWWVGSFLLLLLTPAQGSALVFGWIRPPPSSAPELMFEEGGMHHRFDLGKEADLRQLAGLTSALAVQSAAAERTLARAQHETRARANLEEMSPAQLKVQFAQPPGGRWHKSERGLEYIAYLCRRALEETNASARALDLAELREVTVALQNNRRLPVPASIEFLRPPLMFVDYSYNPVGIGDTPANNLADPWAADLSAVDPLPSTFWRRPDSIARQDLFLGFGRSAPLNLQKPIWDYAGPKTSYGSNPGFDACQGSLRIKVKFGETTSEPFAARIFAALGYHVEATDHVDGLKMRYSRRFFREFHLRREVRTEIKILWLVPIYTIELQKRYDPFAFVAEAVLKDGSRLPGERLKEWLLRRPNGKHPEEDPANFRADREAALAYLVLAPANVQVRDDDAKSIGPWAFEGLGHEDRRELRAAALLAAWLGWVDSRFENTRLKVCSTSHGPQLEHFITDLGGGLGKATGPLTRRGESPNGFPWTCTRPPRPQGRGRMTVPFRITGYEPIQDTLAFERATREDARWMARLIAQLTERQIVEALVAAGFDSAQVRLYTRKLISRRDQMIRDLDLTGEISLLEPAPAPRIFSYDPAVDGPVRLETTSGRQVMAAVGHDCIIDGRLHLKRGPISP